MEVQELHRPGPLLAEASLVSLELGEPPTVSFCHFWYYDRKQLPASESEIRS